MHTVPSTAAFKSQPLTILKELAISWGPGLSTLNYSLLLLVKNFSFRSFVNALKMLEKSFIFLVASLIILLLYPLLYPRLKAFTFIKQSNARPMLANSMKAFSLVLEEVLRGMCLV